MENKIRLRTYPDGKNLLIDNQIVNLVTTHGSFRDTYACELQSGDVYCQRIGNQRPPRTIEDLFNFIAYSELSMDWSRDDDYKITKLEVWKGTTLLVEYPFNGFMETLTDAINYIMDMEEDV
tara:strand:- start:1606 stop:1971 length:366 start_codon:yes stop_codon:yes gene_type:complete